MKWLQENGDVLLAILTSLLSLGHLEHFFSQEWIVLASAIATAVVAFLTREHTPQHQAQPPKPQQPTPTK